MSKNDAEDMVVQFLQSTDAIEKKDLKGIISSTIEKDFPDIPRMSLAWLRLHMQIHIDIWRHEKSLKFQEDIIYILQNIYTRQWIFVKEDGTV